METFSALLPLCAGNLPVTGEFPSQRPVTRSFDIFFDLRMNKRLSKQSWGWRFETPSRPLWRHCIVTHIAVITMASVNKPLHRRPSFTLWLYLMNRYILSILADIIFHDVLVIFNWWWFTILNGHVPLLYEIYSVSQYAITYYHSVNKHIQHCPLKVLKLVWNEMVKYSG